MASWSSTVTKKLTFRKRNSIDYSQKHIHLKLPVIAREPWQTHSRIRFSFSMCISFKSFEFTDSTLNYASTSLRMVVVYRPPPSPKNRLSVTLFLDEFSSLLEKLIISTAPLVITGDFNFHLDSPRDRAAARFREMLNIFDLKQHVKDSTHKNGHIFDLVITRAGGRACQECQGFWLCYFWHCAVRWEAPCLKKPLKGVCLLSKTSFYWQGSVSRGY